MADVIAAISTAMQKGGIAVIRISGDDAFKIADKVFRGKTKIEDSESHRILYGHVYDEDLLVDECLCSVMKGPRSFTAENVVEISVHGGIIPAKRTLEAVIKAGARAAKAGEFTMRAFLNGRIDLSKAEAVADIIDSKTDLARSTAVNQLSGKLSSGINEIRDKIIEIMGYISVSTDFPDEDADSLSGIDIKEELSLLKSKTEGLIKNADKGIILREGAVCAICGKPNAGKSSLLNELAGSERAIVTEIEGTTRDIIEEYVNIFDIPVRLADTAGIRGDGDTVEKIGIEMALNEARDSDVVFAVFDVSDKDFESLWGPFLTDFVKHLEEKGWLEITNIAADERAPEDMEVVIKVMNKYAPQLGFAMADNHASYRRIQNVRDCCVAQRQLYLTQEEIDERRAKGYVTTFYVCCSTFFPNTWTFSQPWESELLSWHALSKDYDGQLRWAYNSWPARPEYDSRFRRWGSGDTFQVYPYARSTMRFERFRDGIEAYEKMHILRKKYAGNPALQPLEEHLAKMASLKLTDKSLPWDEMVDQAQELLNSISRQLAE